MGIRDREEEPDRSAFSDEINDAIGNVEAFCTDIQRHIGGEVFARDGMEKQALSAYAFGGIHVLSQQLGLGPPQAHAITLAINHNFFGYSEQDSAIKAETLIEATADQFSTLNAIIHRGIDGFLAWQQNRDTFDAADFHEVLAILRQAK